MNEKVSELASEEVVARLQHADAEAQQLLESLEEIQKGVKNRDDYERLSTRFEMLKDDLNQWAMFRLPLDLCPHIQDAAYDAGLRV